MLKKKDMKSIPNKGLGTKIGELTTPMDRIIGVIWYGGQMILALILISFFVWICYKSFTCIQIAWREICRDFMSL